MSYSLLMHTIFSGKLAAIKFTVIDIDVETLIFERDPRNSYVIHG